MASFRLYQLKDPPLLLKKRNTQKWAGVRLCLAKLLPGKRYFDRYLIFAGTLFRVNKVALAGKKVSGKRRNTLLAEQEALQKRVGDIALKTLRESTVSSYRNAAINS